MAFYYFKGHSKIIRLLTQIIYTPDVFRKKRILQSLGLLCPKLSSRSDRRYEYFKVPNSYASSPQAASSCRTNISKSRTLMPQSFKSFRQAIRILQSPRLLCLCPSCPSGRPYEYQKAEGTIASIFQAESAGPTNTSKFQPFMPLSLLPLRQATRILQSSTPLCL